MPSDNAYSRPVTLKNVLKFAVPTIVMTVFMSFYTMVDGLFVSNLIGTDALSAVNLTAPIISLCSPQVEVPSLCERSGNKRKRKQMRTLPF